MLQQLLFSLSLLLLPSLLLAQFDLEKVDGPNGFFFDEYIGEIEGVAYLTYWDDDLNSKVFSYDENVFTELATPPNWSYSRYAGIDGDDHYLIYNTAANGSSMVLLNETGWNVLFDLAPGNTFIFYAFKANGFRHFIILDVNFNVKLGYYDGTDFILVTPPNNFSLGSYLGRIDELVYFSSEKGLNNDRIYAYDGISFSSVSIPFISPNQSYVARRNGGIYLNIKDVNSNGSLFFFDGTAFSLIAPPANFTKIDYLVGNINDRLFISYDDDYFNGTVLELEMGNTWNEITNPTGMFYDYNFGPRNVDEYLYLHFKDNYSIDNLVVFDGNDHKVVPNPNGREFDDYYLDLKKGHLLGYNDASIYSNDKYLYFYDQTDLTAIASPFGFILNRYSFRYKSKAYFSHYDNNTYDKTLFSLKLNTVPVSADNTVTTERETPYTFTTSDFDFSDEDAGDTFEAIELVNLPSKGLLHVLGLEVEEGDVIPMSDLDKLNYLPLDDGIGEPYDNFTFRVSDGTDFSTENYTMFININASVGIEEAALAEKLTIFPNPVSDFVNIDVQGYASAQSIQVSLMSADGQVLQTKMMEASQERLNLQNLPAGIYHLHFQNDSMKLTRGMIISKKY